jgi:hypothetical protein
MSITAAGRTTRIGSVAPTVGFSRGSVLMT